MHIWGDFQACHTVAMDPMGDATPWIEGAYQTGLLSKLWKSSSTPPLPPCDAREARQSLPFQQHGLHPCGACVAVLRSRSDLQTYDGSRLSVLSPPRHMQVDWTLCSFWAQASAIRLLGRAFAIWYCEACIVAYR